MRLVYDPNQGNKTENKPAEEHTLSGGTVMEETLDQHSKMKGKPFKEQFDYYFGYYKFHALGILAVIGLIISLIVSIVKYKDYGFLAMIVNSSNIDNNLLAEGFAAYANIDTDEYECYISANESELPTGYSNSDVNTSSRFVAFLSSQDLDVAIYDSDMFYRKAINLSFMDLREILSDEDLARYEDRFFYIDMEEYHRIQNNDSLEPFPDFVVGEHSEQEARLKPYMDPSSMKDPIPVGIVIEDANGIKGMNCYSTMIPVFGIAGNTTRPEKALDFLHFLYDESIDFGVFEIYKF